MVRCLAVHARPARCERRGGGRVGLETPAPDVGWAGVGRALRHGRNRSGCGFGRTQALMVLRTGDRRGERSPECHRRPRVALGPHRPVRTP